MKKTAAALLTAALLVIAGPSARAEPAHDESHGKHDHNYKEVSCPGDTPVLRLFERREHHANGRTECVLVDGKGSPAQRLCPADKTGDDCYIAYDPYQEDSTPGNSNHDRGSAIRYHNGDRYSAGHHHGGSGCWDSNSASTLSRKEADRRGKQEIQAVLWDVLRPYTGSTGLATALSDGWYAYPVPESRQLHMIRQFWAGDMHPDEPTRLNARNLESFVIAMTDDGWQPINAMFMIGNEGDEPIKFGADGRALNGPYDYKLIDDEAKLPLWHSPRSSLVCDLSWHGHTGEEGVATSFDEEHPDISDWMAHVGLYAAAGDPFAQERHPDGAEPGAWWAPLRPVPLACNPTGPCE